MAPATATTVFGGSASPTTPPSQGTIMLFTDLNCSSPLANNPTPLLYGDCFAVPRTGIQGISVSSFPSCPDNGTPLLLVSDVGSCENFTQGTGADSGVIGKCQSFSSGVDVKSTEFACSRRGISPAAASNMTMAAAESKDDDGNNDGNDDGVDNGDSCSCCCTVM